MHVRSWFSVAILVASGCAHRADPAGPARVLLIRLADAVEKNDVKRVDSMASRTRAASVTIPSDRDAERHEVAAWLRAAATGTARSTARVRMTGALDTSVMLTRDPEGWRVDPDSFATATPSLVSAIEHLVMALERMQSDEALQLLSHPLREAILGASRERIRGLRLLLPMLERDSGSALMRTLTYGHGLRVVLRFENGQWKVEDFN